MWKSSSLKRCLNASVIIVSLWSSKIIIKSILAVTIQFSFRLSYTTMSFHFCFSLNDSSLFFPGVSAIIPRRSSDHIDVPSLARVCVGSWLRCWREKHVSCWIVLPNYIKDGPTLKAYFLLSLSSCVCVCVCTFAIIDLALSYSSAFSAKNQQLASERFFFFPPPRRDVLRKISVFTFGGFLSEASFQHSQRRFYMKILHKQLPNFETKGKYSFIYFI